MSSAENDRLRQARERDVPWKKWGPYLSERQWGTVREDYSHDGDAWQYFPHDQARSRASALGERKPRQSRRRSSLSRTSAESSGA